MPQTFKFAQWPISSQEVFFASKLSLGFVNLKPVVPGHVLVVPRRVVKRIADLTVEEVSDLFVAAQTIGRVVEKEYAGESLTVTVQDGPMAGQTVAHVHIHIMPRKKGDFFDNDDIYPEINRKEKELAKTLDETKKGGPDAEERPPRSRDEMAVEAGKLRLLFEQTEDIWS
ncbi:putative histidine triad protein [Chytridium lagenaria]|nr:putative histidine triad protein [Chytridium lagenaria]